MSYVTYKVSEQIPIVKDAYTREQIMELFNKTHGLDSAQSVEAFDYAVRNGYLKFMTAKDIWALPASAKFEGDVFIPYDEAEFTVVLPKKCWEIGSLRAWFGRSFDRTWTIAPVPALSGKKRRYIKPISRLGALMALSEVRHDMRWISERHYCFQIDRFSTGFTIEQYVPIQYTASIYVPPEKKRYVGSLRWCESAGDKKKNKYKFFREISIMCSVGPEVTNIDEFFKCLIEQVLIYLNYPESTRDIDYPRFTNVMDEWADSCLYGKYSNKFEVSEVSSDSDRYSQPDGSWIYEVYSSADQSLVQVVSTGNIRIDDCIEHE